MKKALLILFLLQTVMQNANAQLLGLSLTSDLGVQRSFKKDQKFWTVGNTTGLSFHVAPQHAVYVSFAYFSNAKFYNQLSAIAKDTSTSPSSIAYTNKADLRIKNISIGYKKYFKGSYDADKNWNLYGSAGFGILFGKVANIHNLIIDSSLYSIPVRAGRANFKRLTLDLAFGAEYPVSNDIFLYGESRIYIPTTDYPSKYLFVNENAPFTALISGGVRLLF